MDEILAAVNNALYGCPAPATPTATNTPPATPTATPTLLPGDMVAIIGGCRKPGPRGLVSCDVGTVIDVSRCDDYGACTTRPEARTPLGEGLTDTTGSFSIPVRRSLAQGALLFMEAPHIDSATVYRILDFGPVSAGGVAQEHRVAAPQGVPLVEVTIDPSAEAAVRLLDQNGGLPNFSHDGIPMVLQAVRTATQHSTFAGLSPSAAADQAATVANNDAMVQQAIQQSEFAGTICFADQTDPTLFKVTLDTSLKTASAIEVDLAVLYAWPYGNPVSYVLGGGCSWALGVLGSFTYDDDPGRVRFTFQSATPRKIPTPPLFSCSIDAQYSYPIVVSCLSGYIDNRPLKCCASPFRTKVVIVQPGNGCCQFNESCLDVNEANCTAFRGQPFLAGYGCDHGVGCNEQ